MSGRFCSVDAGVWGHSPELIDPGCLIEVIADEVAAAIANFDVALDGPEPGSDEMPASFVRVFANICVREKTYDQFFNGPSGYRAQYYLGADNGEAFNRTLVETVAPLLVSAEQLYRDKVDRQLCQSSLLGSYSKFWFSRQITDPAEQAYLDALPEVIIAQRWRAYWQGKSKPWKGLLAPLPEETMILLNGTFLNSDTGEERDSKLNRSEELFRSGWT
jgi:hypothetical protein